MFMNEEYQMMAARAIAHEADMVKRSAIMAIGEYERPSVLFRPSLKIDGNQWCALYGENLQDGIAGFGSSPYQAMLDFDRAWARSL